MKDFDKLRELLDDLNEYPMTYEFKFILPLEKLPILKNFLGEGVEKIRPSRNGKYIGYTFFKEVNSTSEIVEIYKKVLVIEGLMSL